jgi:hypothetical protein
VANSLGALTVQLGLDASEYTRGLTRAEAQARQFSRNMRSTIGDIVGILGGLQLGSQFLQATKDIIAEAAALNDLSDATGSSVEALSRLNNQAKIAGADFGTLQAALLKLSQGMAGAEDESNKTKEALRILGITTKDPVEALQQAALKLNTYADGVNKVGFAVALFGKQGAAFLATLKDIAEAQNVGATVTAQQAAEAEELEKAFRRLSYESTTFKNSILNDVVPVLLRLITTFNDARTASNSFGVGLDAALSLAARGGNSVQQLRAVDSEIAKIKESLTKGLGIGGLPLPKLAEEIKLETLSRLEAQRAALEQDIRRQARKVIDKDVESVFGPKPAAPNPPRATTDGRTARALKEQTTEAERYLQSLQKQHQATLDLSAVQTAEIAIYDLKQKALSGLTPAIESQIRAFAEALDQQKEAKRVAEEERKSQEAAARAREQYAESQRRAVEAAEREVQAIRDGVEQTREQIILITQGQEALDAYNAAKREKVALELEDRAATLAAFGDVELAQKYREQAAALRELNSAAGSLRVAEAMKQQTEAIAALKGEIFDIVGDSISDLIVNGAKAGDVLKRLEKDLLSFLTSQALSGLKSGLLGGSGSGSDIFSMLAQLALSFAGGGSTGGLNLSSYGPAFAAAGTTYARGGATVVGELGIPEIVNLPPGARVTPANYSSARMGGGITINQSINVPAGANKQSARQIANQLYSITAAAARDR